MPEMIFKRKRKFKTFEEILLVERQRGIRDTHNGKCHLQGMSKILGIDRTTVLAL